MKRRQFLGATAATVATLTSKSEALAENRRKPNFIIVLCDDLGWGISSRTAERPSIRRISIAWRRKEIF